SDGPSARRTKEDALARARRDRPRAHLHRGLSDLVQGGAGGRGSLDQGGARRVRPRRDRQRAQRAGLRLRGVGDPLPAAAQVRLRVSATGTDALETATEPKPALRERVATAVRVLAG